MVKASKKRVTTKKQKGLQIIKPKNNSNQIYIARFKDSYEMKELDKNFSSVVT